MPLVEEWLAGVVVVSEDEVGDAMAMLLADAKLVVEGAGAVGVAALASGKVEPAPEGTTAVVLSGGNIDESLLAAIARRSGARHGRGAVIFTKISDRPGSLAALLDAVGATGASVVDVQHVRDAMDLHVAETGVELILETRGREHTADVVSRLRGERVRRQAAAPRGDLMGDERKTVDADGAPAAVGPYSHAVASGGLLFCSGQIPLDPGSGEIVGGDAAGQADPVPAQPAGRLRGGGDRRSTAPCA